MERIFFVLINVKLKTCAGDREKGREGRRERSRKNMKIIYKINYVIMADRVNILSKFVYYEIRDVDIFIWKLFFYKKFRCSTT